MLPKPQRFRIRLPGEPPAQRRRLPRNGILRANPGQQHQGLRFESRGTCGHIRVQMSGRFGAIRELSVRMNPSQGQMSLRISRTRREFFEQLDGQRDVRADQAARVENAIPWILRTLFGQRPVALRQRPAQVPYALPKQQILAASPR